MSDQQYAWCFSHGRMHAFALGKPPWCTAEWVAMYGATEEEALSEKHRRFGEAQFMHHLPLEKQAEIAGVAR